MTGRNDSGGSELEGSTGDSAGARSGESRHFGLTTRRGLLGALSVGGSLALSGCGSFGRPGNDTGSPASPAGTPGDGRATVDGQTLRVPTGQDPAKTSFLVTHFLAAHVSSTFSHFALEPPTPRLTRFIRESGVWADGLWVDGRVQYNWIAEPIEISPTEVTVTVREDARWSDGHRITGRDIALDPLQRHIRTGLPPYYAADEADSSTGSDTGDTGDTGGTGESDETPSQIFEAIDDFEISDRSVTYRSSPGYFDEFWDLTVALRLASFNQFTGNPRFYPTHIEPYDEYASAVFETVKRAQRGEIDPWNRTKPWNRPGDPDLNLLAKRHLGKKKYVKKFTRPKHVLATGAWDPVEFRESEGFVFAKNPYHRNADAINFDRLVFEYTPSGRRKRAALAADRLDFVSTGTVPEEYVASLPAGITELRIPGGIGTGNELALNFDTPALDKRAGRAAMMYALDQETIANNVHPTVAEPIDTPGGDCWDATEYASEEWVAENLTTYSTDRDRAASFMREAGYSREGETWTDAEGEPITLTVSTASNTPKWEPAVASQLSDFGIETTVSTLGESTFSSRRASGQLSMWPAALNATNLAPATLLLWFYAPQRHERYGIYPDEQFETGTFSDEDDLRPFTEDRWDAFTIEAPPVGEPDGDLREYHPSALALFLITNPPEAEFRRRVKTGMWLANWFLPTIPINRTLQQHFIDDAHWLWPKDTPSWAAFTGGGPRTDAGLLASGTVRANPDDPET